MKQKPIPILMYHSIETMPKGTVMRGLHVTPKRFAFQMRLLRLFGYQGLSMNKLQPYLEGEKTGKVVGLTFDDGYKNNLTNALPTLKKHDFVCVNQFPYLYQSKIEFLPYSSLGFGECLCQYPND